MCSRPAVSMITTSRSRACAAADRVERHRRRIRRPTATTRSRRRPAPPRPRSCSPAAARNVSAAPITHDLARPRAGASAILPIDVVLPVPFTPVIRITAGRCAHIDARVAHRAHQLRYDRGQPVAQLLRVAQAAGVRLALEPLDHLDRRRHAAVGVDQRLLQPLPHVRIRRVEHDRRQLLRHRLAALGEALAHPREQPAALLLLGLGRHGGVAAGGEHLLPGRRHRAAS